LHILAQYDLEKKINESEVRILETIVVIYFEIPGMIADTKFVGSMLDLQDVFRRVM
jgi:hypothetical protein